MIDKDKKYITKPYDGEQFYDFLDRVIDNISPSKKEEETGVTRIQLVSKGVKDKNILSFKNSNGEVLDDQNFDDFVLLARVDDDFFVISDLNKSHIFSCNHPLLVNLIELIEKRLKNGVW